MNIRLMALSSIIVVGCTGDPLALTPEDISFSVASAACQRIEFDASMALGATGFAGTVTGDLEGTIRVVFTQPAIAHGVANLNDGTDFIDVTGGSFPDLIGTTVEHRHDNMFVLAPGLGAVGRLNGHGSLVGDVDGHWNFHGTLVNAFPFPIEVTYRGNICID